MTEYEKILAQRLKKSRMKAGHSQIEASTKIGIDLGVYGRFERGQKAPYKYGKIAIKMIEGYVKKYE